MKKSTVFLLALCCIAFNCAAPEHITKGQIMPGFEIQKEGKFVILNITDGQESGQSPAYGSGQEMVSAIKEELMKNGYVFSTVPTENLLDGFNEADRLGYLYVLKGIITHWEDNATEWSGKPDRASFSLDIYVSKDRKLIGSASHQVQGSGMALFPESTTRFIPELANKTLSRLLSWPDVSIDPEPKKVFRGH